jgi:hypothetical protein
MKPSDPPAQPEAAAPAGPTGADVRPQLIPGGAPPDGAEVAASPGEQAELDQVVNKALFMIHGRKSRADTVKMLHDPNRSVAEVVGNAAFRILSTISDQKNASTREPVSESVLEEAASYVVPELLEVGIAAGLFPIDPPDPGAEEVGAGNAEFDKQVQLALLEAVKAYGESELRSDRGPRRTEEAQNEWARGIAQEVQNGTADPEYMQVARSALAPPGGEANGTQLE